MLKTQDDSTPWRQTLDFMQNILSNLSIEQNLVVCKGQIISEAIFHLFNSPMKQTIFLRISALASKVGQK